MVITKGINFYVSGEFFSLDSTKQKVFSDNFFKKIIKKTYRVLVLGDHYAYFKVNLDKNMTEKYKNVYMHRKPSNLNKGIDEFIVDFTFYHLK